MAVETDAIRDIFLDTDDFGTSATYTPTGGSATALKGIFDNDYETIDIGGFGGIQGTQPRFLVRSSDVASAIEGEPLVINAVNYQIKVIEQDGTGFSSLVLEEQ
tara:strand:- start:63 stop:374 length:312 start_codon:yes stop_codon:yes gene_type:complete